MLFVVIFMSKRIPWAYYKKIFGDEINSQMKVSSPLTFEQKKILFLRNDNRLNIKNEYIKSVIESVCGYPNRTSIVSTLNEIYYHLCPSVKERMSICSIGYWISRGYDEEYAISEIRKHQKKSSARSNEVFSREYWKRLGYSDFEIDDKIKEAKTQRSSFTLDFWISRGFSEDEAKKKVYDIASNGSWENFKKRNPEDTELLWEEKIKRQRRFGEKNHQYGKPSAIGSGSGISGYYKNYYFRSLYEYFYMKGCENDGINFIPNDVTSKEHKNKIVIPYRHNGKDRNYIPDFIVGDKIVEIKSKYGFGELEWRLKEEALKQYIENSDEFNSYEKVSEDDLTRDYNLLNEDYKNGVVIIDKGKLKRFERHLTLKL